MKLRNLLLMSLFLVPSFAAANSHVARSAAVCTSDADCSGHGSCNIATGICACVDGYITPTHGAAGGQCSYAQQSQLKIFLLQLFLGYLGVGEFVAGNTGWGVGQLLVTLGATGLTIGAIIAFMAGAVGGGACGFIIGGGLIILAGLADITTFAWWLADSIMWGMGTRVDGNGEKAKKDM